MSSTNKPKGLLHSGLHKDHPLVIPAWLHTKNEKDMETFRKGYAELPNQSNHTLDFDGVKQAINIREEEFKSLPNIPKPFAKNAVGVSPEARREREEEIGEATRLHNEWYCRYIAPGSEAAQNYQNNQKKKDLEREMRTSANQTHEELDPESYRVISAVMLSILKKKQKA